MKKINGFTLMELISVIALIGVISILAVIPINKAIKDSREKLRNDQERKIILAAENWSTDNPYSLPPYVGDDIYVDISIEKLTSEGYIDTTVVDMIDKTKIETCSYVRITLNTDAIDGNRNTYKYAFYEVDEC